MGWWAEPIAGYLPKYMYVQAYVLRYEYYTTSVMLRATYVAPFLSLVHAYGIIYLRTHLHTVSAYTKKQR